MRLRPSLTAVSFRGLLRRILRSAAGLCVGMRCKYCCEAKSVVRPLIPMLRSRRGPQRTSPILPRPFLIRCNASKPTHHTIFNHVAWIYIFAASRRSFGDTISKSFFLWSQQFRNRRLAKSGRSTCVRANNLCNASRISTVQCIRTKMPLPNRPSALPESYRSYISGPHNR